MNVDQNCPISYVLTYDQIAPKTQLKFKGMDVPFGADNVARVHFYAEPASGPTSPAHLDMALDALDGLFDPKLTLKFPSGSEPDQPLGYVPPNDSYFTDESHPGVRPCEQLSLAERLQAEQQKQGCMQYFQLNEIDQPSVNRDFRKGGKK